MSKENLVLKESESVRKSSAASSRKPLHNGLTNRGLNSVTLKDIRGTRALEHKDWLGSASPELSLLYPARFRATNSYMRMPAPAAQICVSFSFQEKEVLLRGPSPDFPSRLIG